MKTIILAACMLATAGTFANPNVNYATYEMLKEDGQHISASQVPGPVIMDFNSRYPDAKNTKWEVESEHGKAKYKADFKRSNNARVRAEWLANGTFLGEK